MGFKKGNQFGKQNLGRKRPDAIIRMKGNKLWIKNIGTKRTKEQRKNMSKAVLKRYINGEKFGFQKGKNNPMKNKKIRKKVSITLKKAYKKGRIVWNKDKPHMALDKHWNWQNGKSFEPYPISFNIKLKKLIKERDKYKCFICGSKKKILYVHHIDYDKNNYNQKNLITLCPSCHSKTNYNRNKWKKYFKNEK